MLKNLLSLFCLIFLFYSLSLGGDSRDKSFHHSHCGDRFLDYGTIQKRNPQEMDIPIQTYDGYQPLEPRLAAIMGVVKDDFRVDNDISGSAYQSSPSIAIDGSGNFVIAWADDRNGNSDICYQRYNASGVAQGTNVKVNDDAGTAGQVDPAVAMDRSGNFVIAWADVRNGNTDIYFQRYNVYGVAQGPNIKANDDGGIAEQGFPSLVMDGSGNFVITWDDARNDYSDIYYQRYNASGVAQGANVKVNDDTVTANQSSPSIAIDGSGNFVIAWGDDRNGNGDIYYQEYNAYGVAKSANAKVNDDAGTAVQDFPSIAMDREGNFVIAWEDGRNGVYIYFQRYNASGLAQGRNIMVNDDMGSALQRSPSIVMDDSGNFVMVWEALHTVHQANWDIYYQRYNASGQAQSGNARVSDTGTASQLRPSIAMDSSGNSVIAWADGRNGNYDIYYQRYNVSGVAQGVNVMANDDVWNAWQDLPSIAMDDIGNFVIAWQDYRNGGGDIYFQRYDASGVAQNGNVSANNEKVYQSFPSIAMDASGNFVLAWQDYRNDTGRRDNPDIYYQRYNSSGLAQARNGKVNDDVGIAIQDFPAIVMDASGNFVIAWGDARNGNSDIYYQRYNSSGVAQGVNVKANDVQTAGQAYPAIAMNNNGNFVIAWVDDRNGMVDIYYQRYNTFGVAQGVNVRANEKAGTATPDFPSIVMDEEGNFVIAWVDTRNGNNDIFFQRYNAAGVAHGSNKKANDDTGTAWQGSPSIAMDRNGNLVIVWEDCRYGVSYFDIIGQRYCIDGSPWGANYRIVTDGPYQGETTPKVAAHTSFIVFSWLDNRQSGWDIYGKIATWDWEGVTSVEQPNIKKQLLVSGYQLLQNYPNPFNPETSISFALPKEGHAILRIYDITSKLVKTLMDEYKTAGYYTIKWTGKNEQDEIVPSGLYLYQIVSDKYSSVKKMVMVK